MTVQDMPESRRLPEHRDDEREKTLTYAFNGSNTFLPKPLT